MSIYGSRKRWNELQDLQRQVRDGAPQDAADEAPPDRGADWAPQRKAEPADFILPATRTWLAALPDDVRPATLVERYARIVNRIAQQWNDKVGCPALFDELLGDRRGGRAGFPAKSQRDLVRLQEYWYNGRGRR
ncbi:MAG: hypothetical protein JSS46_01280 [Proteobacteria bacterium]|jgi:hypothetical protein|nr:hypothetical protein [Pseudomonadota bacterium]